VSVEIKIPFDELRRRSLFLGTPCYGGQCTAMFARSVADLSAQCAQLGVGLQIYFLINESLIPRARNMVCDEFMRGKSTHMIFIDSDIHFDARDVIAMLAMASDDTEYDILCAPYPKKSLAWEKIKAAVDQGLADKDPNVLDRFVGDFVFNPIPGSSGKIEIDKPLEVLESGTGFMMFKRSTLERFRDAYPEYWYKPDHVRSEHFDGTRDVFMYFQSEIDRVPFEKVYRSAMKRALETDDPQEVKRLLAEALDTKETRSRRYLSEDYWHCQMARRIGIKTWLCPWMKTTHTGTFNFGGSLRDLASIGAAATADVNLLREIKKRKSG
jgi:hypothetical protein